VNNDFQVVPSQCRLCTHLVESDLFGTTVRLCSAFPGGIPPAVFANQTDHRVPIKGQVRDAIFTPRSDADDQDLQYLQSYLDARQAAQSDRQESVLHTLARVLGLKSPTVLGSKRKWRR
jgi:hypothetical protein